MPKWPLVARCMALVTAVLSITAAPAHAQPPEPEKRFPQLTLDQLNDQQRALGEEILKISSVGLAGPYNPMLRSPIMAGRLFRLLDYLRFNTSLPRRLNEFAILIQARSGRRRSSGTRTTRSRSRPGCPRRRRPI